MLIYATDTAGQERFRTITASYYGGADICFAGFDVTWRESFNSCDRWINDARSNCPKCIVCAVGNKIDLADERQVTTEEAREHFAAMNPPVPYFEISATKNIGINELFESAVRKWLERPETNENREDPPSGGSCVVC